MKNFRFRLSGPVRLVPVSGNSEVRVSTSGSVRIEDYTPTGEARQRRVELASTKYGKLTESPGGLYRTLTIRLPRNIASSARFEKEADMLFEVLELKGL